MKMLLEILRLYSAAYLGEERHGSAADDMVLLAAIFVGQAEGRLMNPSKLAVIAGLPRPTVIRKLQRLEGAGVLVKREGHYKVRLTKANGDAVVGAACGAARLVKATAAKLSKMDT